MIPVLVEGEDGLPCRHPDLDWLDGAATCPECGALLTRVAADLDEVVWDVDAEFTPIGPKAEDEVDLPINGHPPGE